jgi:hypothetical protein
MRLPASANNPIISWTGDGPKGLGLAGAWGSRKAKGPFAAPGAWDIIFSIFQPGRHPPTRQHHEVTAWAPTSTTKTWLISAI